MKIAYGWNNLHFLNFTFNYSSNDYQELIWIISPFVFASLFDTINTRLINVMKA